MGMSHKPPHTNAVFYQQSRILYFTPNIKFQGICHIWWHYLEQIHPMMLKKIQREVTSLLKQNSKYQPSTVHWSWATLVNVANFDRNMHKSANSLVWRWLSTKPFGGMFLFFSMKLIYHCPTTSDSFDEIGRKKFSTEFFGPKPREKTLKIFWLQNNAKASGIICRYEMYLIIKYDEIHGLGW